MSVQATHWALYDAPQVGANLGVLLYLADRADEHGRNAFPSKATIARDVYGYPPEPSESASKEEKDKYNKAKGSKERIVQRILKELRDSGHISVDKHCVNTVFLSIPSHLRPTAYKLNLSLVRGGKKSSTHTGEEIDSPRRNPPTTGDEIFQQGRTNLPTGEKESSPKPSVKPSGEPSGEGERLQELLRDVQPPLTPTSFENSLDQKPIPQEWLNDYSGMEYCHEHPDGNKDRVACRGCGEMKQRIKALREQSERQNAEQQRLKQVKRQFGKDNCDICNHQGQRDQIMRSRVTNLVSCNHEDEDRREAIAALEYDGKHEEAQRLGGLTIVQAS